MVDNLHVSQVIGQVEVPRSWNPDVRLRFVRGQAGRMHPSASIVAKPLRDVINAPQIRKGKTHAVIGAKRESVTSDSAGTGH
jgi:hypothetical protein